jgi:pimeloyl-ACP methyl ester carboxylesterase
MELKVDGRAVFAATGGKAFHAGLPAVVFVHGAAMDHTVWQLQTRYFAYHGRSVLAVDLPGHGRSEGAPLESVEAIAAWLIRLIDAAGPTCAALVGHSMGALAALAAAGSAPGRLEKLALLGVAARVPVHPELMDAARSGENLASALVTAWGFGRQAHYGGHRGPGLWMTGGGYQLLERADAGVLANDLAASAAYEGAVLAAGQVDCPTLLLLGEADRMTPPKSARPLSEALADTETVVLPGTGHMMTIEEPDRTLDALKAFI